MKQRFYFDTSVFGGVYDVEFEEDTLQLFEMVKMGHIICVYSNLTESEIIDAPKRVKEYFENIKANYAEKVVVTQEILELAATYTAEKVVGETSFDDCVHIATATLYQADVLVSWNFKHIVNIYRIKGYNTINLRKGYNYINIHSPKEIVGYEG